MASLLEDIIEEKEREIAELPEAGGLSSARAEKSTVSGSSFKEAVSRAAGQSLRIIAEMKKASPSAGLLREDYRPDEIAITYQKLGASALSVLTDRRFFQGNSHHLIAAAAAGLPLLRKDFILSEKQIYEAYQLGAAAILLIVRLLSEKRLQQLYQYACQLGLDVLVEVHNIEEAKLAVNSGAEIIGINHRDLDTLQMDLSLTEKITPILRDSGCIVVGESGIETPEGLQKVEPCVDAVLIGTAFMKSRDIVSTYKDLFAS